MHLWPTADIEALNKNGDVVGGGGIWFYNNLSFSGIDAVLNDVNDGDIAVGMGIGVDNGRPIMVSNGVITDLSTLNGADKAHEAYAINNKSQICTGTEFEDGGLIIDIPNSTVTKLSFAGNEQSAAIYNQSGW